MAITRPLVKKELDKILVPGAMRSLVKLNLVRSINTKEDSIKITLSSTALNTGTQEWLKAKTDGELVKLPGVKKTEVEYVENKPPDINSVDHVVAVMSGKGGVGKSLITSLLGASLARQGYEVGILDADITGPSIPKMFGISARPNGTETGIFPVLSKSGIGVMSINLILPGESDAVIWRGPLITGAIKQFWEDVLWGNLDYLLIDLPPGTADAPLTVFQALPISGVVMVFTPQELAAMVVKKAVQMTVTMKVPILGVVENMSYFISPDKSKKIEIFGPSKAKEMAIAAQAPLLGQLPIDPELARLSDAGEIERYDSKDVQSMTENFLKAVSQRAKQKAKK